MKTKKVLFFIPFIIVVLLLYSCGSNNTAAENNARTIAVFKNEGTSITIAKEDGRTFAAKEGNKLFEGYILTTGADSYTYLSLDNASMVKVDQNSVLEVTRLNDKNLKLSVIEGAISVDAAPQLPDNTLEVGAGNSALAVRGTLFVVENGTQTKPAISMLSGLGVIDERELASGYSVGLINGKADTAPFARIIISPDMSMFMLQTIIDNKELLLAENIFSADELNSAQNFLNEKQNSAKQSASSTVSSSASTTNSSSSVASKRADSSLTSSGSTRAYTSSGSAAASSSSSGTSASSSATSTATSSSSSSGTVARVGNVNYSSIAEAINAATASTPVQIIESSVIPQGTTVTLQPNAQILIDAGKSLTINGSMQVGNNATVTINGSLLIQPTGSLQTNTGSAITLAANSRLENNGSADISGSISAQGEGATLVFAPASTNNGAGINNTLLGVQGTTIPAASLPGKTFVYMSGQLRQAAIMLQAQNQAPVYYPDLTTALNDSAGKTVLIVASMELSGTTPSNTTIEIASGVTLTLSGNTTCNSSFIINGTLAVNQPFYTYTDLTINNGGQLNVASQQALSLNGTIVNNGVINSSGTIYAMRDITNNGTINSNGPFSVTNGGTLRNTGTFVSGGSFSNIGTFITSGSFTSTSTINSTGTLTVNGGNFITSANNFRLDTGTVNFSSGTIKIQGNIAPGAGNPTSTITFGNSLTYEEFPLNLYFDAVNMPLTDTAQLAGNTFTWNRTLNHWTIRP